MRFERTASSLGGKRSVLLSYEDDWSGVQLRHRCPELESNQRPPVSSVRSPTTEPSGLEQGLTVLWKINSVCLPIHSSPAKAPFTSGDGVLIGSTTPQA